jgi:dsDNA-specific endonuclease/ATPase MutS2
MEDKKDEIQELVRELQQLQLRQSEILVRLERASRNERNTGQNEGANEYARRPEDKRTTRTDESREFVIGDKVRVINPGRFQTNRGVIVKIGASRITLRTKSGGNIQRAPKNLIFDKDE